MSIHYPSARERWCCCRRRTNDGVDIPPDIVSVCAASPSQQDSLLLAEVIMWQRKSNDTQVDQVWSRDAGETKLYLGANTFQQNCSEAICCCQRSQYSESEKHQDSTVIPVQVLGAFPLSELQGNWLDLFSDGVIYRCFSTCLHT